MRVDNSSRWYTDGQRGKPYDVVRKIPPAVSDLFNSPCMVYVRAMSETKYWSIPNPHFAEYAVQRGADQVVEVLVCR